MEALTIQGKVVAVERAPPNEARFTVLASSLGSKRYRCFCPYFFPVTTGDIVNVSLRSCGPPPPGATPSYNVVSPPLGLIPTDADSVLDQLVRCLRTSYEEACELTSCWLTDLCPSAFDYLEKCVEVWAQTGLAIVPGLNENLAKQLLAYWCKRCLLRRLYLFGLNNREINAARNDLLYTYREIYECLLQNALALPTITVEKGLEIFSRLGMEANDEIQACAYIVRTLYDRLRSGYTSYPLKYLCKKHPLVRELQVSLMEGYQLVEDYDCLYFRKVHELEVKVTTQIQSLLRLPEEEVELLPSLLEKIGGSNLSPDQVEALEGALRFPISIITGAAGTGKTTLIARLVSYFREQGLSYLVCSFTGKAVARIKEVLQKDVLSAAKSDESEATPPREPFYVSTISRYVYREKLPDSAKKDLPRDHPLYVIIDEMSMTTMSLFSQLLESIHTHLPRIIMVGDVNQLPPVGWGSLFSPCSTCGLIPTYKLTQSHRFLGERVKDGIFLNSDMIVKYIEACETESPLSSNKLPSIILTRTDNFQLVKPDLKAVLKILKNFYFSSGVEKPAFTLTVISPYNETVNTINQEAQELLFADRIHLKDSKGNKWYLGDRVMMLRNDYELGVMNGEEGVVIALHFFLGERNEMLLFQVFDEQGETTLLRSKEEITPISSVTVRFLSSGREHNFPLNPKETEEEGDNEFLVKERSMRLFSLSYALTVHKAQGSEWPFILVFIPKRRAEEISSFISRNLLYTAMTRARQGVFFAVDPQSLTKIMDTSSEKLENLSRRLAPDDIEDDWDDEGEGEVEDSE